MGVQMRRTLAAAAGAIAVLILAEPARAQLPGDTARIHVVRPGDTMWDLARLYFENPFDWRRIYEANLGDVENPHWIYPDERLVIPGPPGAGGMPVGSRGPATGARPDEETARAAPRQAPGGGELQAEEHPRTVFFPSPSLEGRRLLGPEDEPSAVVARGEFYGASLLIPDIQVNPVGGVVEVKSPTVIPVDPPTHPLPFELVYMTLARPGAVDLGDTVQLVRGGRVIEPYGRVVQATGTATVTAIEGRTATLEVQEHFAAIAVGDLVFPLPAYTVPLGVRPESVPPEVNGRLVAFESLQPVQAVRDLGFIDLGRMSGLREGDVLEAVIDPERRVWGERPEIIVARLQVVRVAERTSTVQVISMEYPALRTGLRVRLVARMPQS
jgi:hypothetical protein